MKKNTKTYTLSLSIPAYLDFEAPEDATEEEILDLAQKAFDALLRDEPEIKLDVYNGDMDAYAIDDKWAVNYEKIDLESLPWCRDIETRNGTLYYV